MADEFDDAFAKLATQKAITSLLIDQPAPDAAGRANRVARTTGVPADTADRNLAALERQAQLARAKQLIEAEPNLARWASNPRNAAVGIDDMESMSKISKGFQDAWARIDAQKPKKTWGQTLRDAPGNVLSSVYAGLSMASQGVTGVLKASDEVRDTIDPFGWIDYGLTGREGRGGKPGSPESLRRHTAAPQLDRLIAIQQGEIDRSTVRDEGFVGNAMYTGIQSIPSSLAAIVNPVAGLSIMGASTGGQNYIQARKAGVAPIAAASYGARQGTTEVVTEALGPAKWIGGLKAGSPFLKRFLGYITGDVSGELIATTVQNFDQWATIEANQGKPFKDYLAQLPADLAQTAIAALTTGGITTGSMELAGKAARRFDRAAVRAEADQSVIAAVDAAADSKVRERDPEAFRQFIEQHDQGAANDNLFVPAEKVAAFFQSNDGDYRSDSFWRDYADQVDEGLVTGGDVVIPTSAAAAYLAGTDSWEAIKADVRTSPGGISLSEAEAAKGDRDQQLDDLGANMGAEVSANEPYSKNYQDIRDKLTGAGFTQDAAHLNAELVAQRYATRAARLGTPLTGEETKHIEVNQVLPANLAPIVAAAPGAVSLKSIIGVMRGGVSKKSKPVSLLDWIAKQGGIEDRGGDLAAMGAGAMKGAVQKGQRKLIRAHADLSQGTLLGEDGQQNSNSPDELALRAMEAGYFPAGKRPSIKVLYAAIDQELRGKPVHRLDEGDGATKAQAAADELYQVLDQSGIDPMKASEADIRKAIDAYSQAQQGDYQQTDSGWRRLVDKVVRGESVERRLEVTKVSAPLLSVGFSAGDVVMSGAKMAKAWREHSVPLDVWHNLPALIAKPLAVFPSARRDGSQIIATVARDRNGDPVVMALIAEESAGAVILSVYGKSASERTSGDEWIGKEISSAQKDGLPVYLGEGFADTKPQPDVLSPSSAPGPIPIAGSAKPARKILSIKPAVKRHFEQTFGDGPRGQITFVEGRSIVDLFQARNLSTFAHEMGHNWLEELKADAATIEGAAADFDTVKAWMKANGHVVGDDNVIPVEGHELFARGFERFLMEGKAPSSGLRRVFDAFRSWLLNIYQVVDNLRAPITPEIREVMQRLIATDEEIAAVDQKQAVTALFTDAAQAGMSEAEFAAYQASAAEAKGEAHDALLYRTMKALRDARTKAWKDEERGVRDDITTQINRRPEFKALHLLRTGRMLDDAEAPQIRVKLDRGWLTEVYGEGILSALPKSVPPIYSDTGTMHADEIAEMAGFATGDEMIRTLIAVADRTQELREVDDKRSVRQALIDIETQAEMRDRHGDPLNDGSIELDALAAIHNDRQGQVIAAEIRSLSRRSGEQPTPYALAKEWARGKIAAGTVQETTSGSAIQRYARAAAKASRAAEKAMLAQDVEETYRQKRAQMLNNALIAEAGRARDRVDTAVARLARYAKRRTIKAMDQDYLEQIHSLLEQVEFRNRSQASIDRQESFEEWANARQAEGRDIVVPPSFAVSLGTTHWSRLTVEKLIGLDDTVKQIAHLGRLKQKMIDGKEERDFDAVRAEAIGGMDGMKKTPPVSGFMEPGYFSRAKSFVLSIDAAMLKMETVFDWLDGGKFGTFNRYVFQPFVTAQEQRRRRIVDMTQKLEAARVTIPEATRKRWHDKVTLDMIDPETGRPAVMTRDQLIMMAMNVGNAGNAKKLAGGYGWSEGAILATLNRELTAPEWQFVQSTWDIIDTLWPDIAALERRVNGFEPEKVEARAVETAGGTLRGGYFPVVYDPKRNRDAERNAGANAESLFMNEYRRANTRTGAANERTAVERPILLSLSVISRHIGEVIHDVTHREAVIQAHKFLNDPKIARAVDETLGVEVRKQFNPWLHHIANEFAIDAAGMSGVEAFIKGIRTNATFVGMGFRFSTGAMQFAGLSNSAERIGSRWISEGAYRFAKAPIESTKFVLEHSQEVAARMENMDRDIRDAIKREQSKFGLLSRVKEFGYLHIGLIDRFVSVTTWMGGYNRGLSEGLDDAAAIAFADKGVRQSQGSGSAKDLAAIQRGKGNAGEAAKLLTMFYSYMSQFYQRQRTLNRDYGQAIREHDAGKFPALLARTMWLYFFPALASELLAGRPPDDDEDWAWWALEKIGLSALGPLPVIRDVAGGIASGFGYNFTPASAAGRTAFNLWQDGKKLWEGEDTKRATRDVLEMAGYLGAPVSGQVAASTQFLVDVGTGDQQPETAGEWWRGLTTGKTEERQSN